MQPELTSIASNERLVEQAKERAVRRIKDELQKLGPHLRRLGRDTPTNRQLVRDICQLETPSGFELNFVGKPGCFGVASDDGTWVKEISSPDEAKEIYQQVCIFVRNTKIQIGAYMLGVDDTARALVQEWDNCCR